MSPLSAFVIGVVSAAALSVPAGPAYHRVLARRGSGALFAAWRGAGPVVLRDLLPLALAVALALALPRPEGLPTRILALAPLLVWLLWRGWTSVELPAASHFLFDQVRSDVALRHLLGPSARNLGRILLLGLVLSPFVAGLLRDGTGALVGLASGYASAFLLVHGLLAWDQNRRAPRERGPYVLAPATGRLLLAGSGLFFFLAALFVVGEGALLGLGVTRG